MPVDPFSENLNSPDSDEPSVGPLENLSDGSSESLPQYSGESQTVAETQLIPPDAIAYLVVRDGNTWRDVFRLIPGQVTTIGRAPTNRIVIRDEVCSRNHCEIFQSGSAWVLRDLGSRNGTLINGMLSTSDWEMQEESIIQIGSYELGFTYDLTKPIPQFEEPQDDEEETEVSINVPAARSTSEPGPAIVHRARRSRYRSTTPSEATQRDRSSVELARLYRLALDMGTVQNAKELSEIVLNGLFAGTNIDIGAILLFPEQLHDPQPETLQIIAYQTINDQPYQKVSNDLTNAVLENREAILARDVSSDSRTVKSAHLGEIHAKSVICAPVQIGKIIYGLIHLYSTKTERSIDADDLEFTLAVADQFAIALQNLKTKESLTVGLAKVKNENQTLRRQLEIEGELIGDSPTMQELRQNISQIAPTDATTLIRGESGVGKELVARAIHYSSPRTKAPFVCMNCAALSESLLESELFGHEKGSFTGATQQKMGKFEQASTGTLFLDEVGEMSLPIQAKFLRVLEGHPFERVGGQKPIQVDVRVVAATNRHLEKAVEDGSFRKDLYFRLHVVEMRIAPLRDHPTDIPLLANFFLERSARKTNRPVKRFMPDALNMLATYEWPGNVRELQNAVERAVILSTGESVEKKDIQLTTLGIDSGHKTELPTTNETESATYHKTSLEMLEQEHILATLKWTNWNKSQAAQILGIERSTLDRKLKRYQVTRPQAAE